MKNKKKKIFIAVIITITLFFAISTVAASKSDKVEKLESVAIVDKTKKKEKKKEIEKKEIIQEEPKSEEERKVRAVKEVMGEHQYFEAYIAVKNMGDGKEKQELKKVLETVKIEIEEKEKIKLDLYDAKPEDSFIFTYWDKASAEASIKRHYLEIVEVAKANPEGSWGEANANGYIVGANSDIGGWDVLVREGKDGRVLYEGVILTKDGRPVLSDLAQEIRDRQTK